MVCLLFFSLSHGAQTFVSFGLKHTHTSFDRFRTIKTEISRWFGSRVHEWNFDNGNRIKPYSEWASRHIHRDLNYNYWICSNPRIMANSQLKWKWVVSVRKLNKRIQKSTHTHRENNNTQVENVKKANTICGGCEKKSICQYIGAQGRVYIPKKK